ncbi:MAG TPA: 4'-phosphopantetheinyl transferase [Firmicutes bacterium]|nr:4'-phosphopantetheinyl transferase [Bacillota bacterium]
MIMGLGIDIIEIGRIANLIEKKGELLLKRLFTPDELAICGQAAHRLAGRFAAKEAFFKALGTGFRGFKWREVEIQNDALGAPYFRFSGRLQAHLEETGVDRTHVTITHSKEYAVAQVIMEKVKA